MRFSKPTIYLSTGIAIFVLICGGVFGFYNRSYHDPRVLGVSEIILPGINKNVPDIYTETVEVSFGNKILGLQPIAGEPVKVQRQDVRSIYEGAYKNTDVIQTDYPYKLKEELVFSQPGHPLIFKYNIKNFQDFIIEKDQEGNVIFYDKQEYSKGKELSKVFTIPTPFIEDKVGQRSFSAVTTIIESGLLTISIDESWLMKATYPITLDPTVEINILNLYSHPQQGDNWEVEFMTKGQGDLRIIPNDQATIDDDEFTSLTCNGEARAPQILAGDVISYPNWQCDGTGKVVHRTLKAGKHTLRFEFGDPTKPEELITAWAYNDPGDSWWDTDWSYRKSHTVNAATGAGTNYQVKIIAHYGSGSDSGGDVYLTSRSRTDFADVRFTAGNGSTPLDYWLESKIDSNNAVFWVEVTADLSTVNQDIYIYYGNAGQSTSASNGSNTFLFFDDFSGASLNTNKWLAYNNGGSLSTSQSGGILSVTANTTDPTKIIANVGGTGQTGDNVAMRAKFRATSGSNVDQRMGLGVKTATANGQGLNYVLHNFSAKNSHHFLDDALAWGTNNGGTFALSTWYTEEAYYNGSAIYGRFDDGTWYSWTRSGRSGYMALNVGGFKESVASEWDFALIRKIVATEPAHSSWGSEEVPPATDTSKSQIGAVGGAAKMKINTPAATPAGLSSGLVGYWPFNGPNTTWTSATAGTTNDLSGNNNTGTMTNMSRSTSPVAGINGQALKFDGVDDTLTTTNISPGGTSFTISTWVKSDVFGPVFAQDGGQRWYFSVNGTTKKMQFYTDATSWIIGNNAVPLNQWVNLTVVGTPSNTKFYINGNLDKGDGSSGYDFSSNNSAIQIGYSANFGTYFEGSLDEFRIYNRALSADEILQLYKLGGRKVEFQP